MQNYICVTCGVQYEGSNNAPEQCVICNEERQYVHSNGQSWITLETMIKENYQNIISLEEEGLHSLTTSPAFAIGQTAYLVQNDGFNLLWDCITYFDDMTISKIKELGGINAIALSHPHYYSTQVEWAEAFDVPIYIHEDDKEWVMRPSDKIIFWSGESLELHKGLVIHRLGGHFKGGAVLEWKHGNEKKGILLTGDIIQVVADNQWVSFMYSYPNLIPLPAAKVQEIANSVTKLTFDRIYNAFHRVVKENAKISVQKSAKRYVDALNGELFNT
ncbi:MBL fold metallo-hydrolase [Cytobacillus massiliigabonensis]|uniref:MBL fold metallo-hydrolase n=1 Tax=Cytobacillus massiliigabonensis TaxID=1871011 RepID=UPI000C856BEF|nr:MBL fold metallo-hydrolase [Cytobacillus massiliigabonensis]